jgi:hypothetical protein
MDRVPIEEVADKPEPTEENPPVPESVGDGKGLQEMQDLNDLSVIMGFDSPGFGGLGREMEDIYSWARDTSDDPIQGIRTAIDISGIQETGRELIIKLHRWINLDSRMADLQRRKALIK